MDEWKHSDELIAGQPADTLPPDPAVVELVRAARAAKVFIGARNESLRAYVVEANINQAWHILETALTPFQHIKDAE